MKSTLTDVPETTLWTLHNRAYEAERPDGIIRDPKCLEIYHSIDYDYENQFGKPDGSHGVRSMLFDREVGPFLKKHPNGIIINLGEGLETQRFRFDVPQSIWYSIDVEETIQLRERFIQPDQQHRHIAKSALDLSWCDDIERKDDKGNERPILITAQGLLMYFTEQELEPFFKGLSERFPGTYFIFDFLDQKHSDKTMSDEGWMKTEHYKTPQMPWGINQDDIQPTLSKWCHKNIEVTFIPWEFPRGIYRVALKVVNRLHFILNKCPGIVKVKL